MSNILVIGHKSIAPGFRTLGVPVRTPTRPEDTREYIEAVLDNPDIKLVGIEQQYFKTLSEDYQERIGQLESPIFVRLPGYRERMEDDADVISQIESQIQSSLGFYMKLNFEEEGS